MDLWPILKARLKKLLWIALGVYSALVILLVGSHHLRIFTDGDGVVHSDGNVVGGDFIGFYVAGQIAAEDIRSLYDYRQQFARQQKIVQEHSGKFGMLPFVYPPLFGILMIPFGALPFFPALLVWTAISLALYVVCVWSVGRQLRLSVVSRLGFLIAGLAFVPFSINCLGARQTSCVGLLAFTVHYLLLKRGRDGWAGLALGLSYYKPPVFLFFLVMTALRRRWTVLGGFSVAVALLFVLTVAVTGFDGLQAYVRTASLSSYGVEVVPGATSTVEMGVSLLPGLLLLVPTWPWAARTLYLTAAVAAVVAGAFLVRRARPVRPLSPAFDRGFAFDVSLSLLLSPYLMVYDLSLLLLPFMLITTQWFRSAIRGPDAIAAVAVGGLFVEFLSREPMIVLGIQPATFLLTLWVASLGWSLVSASRDKSGLGPGPELTRRPEELTS